MEPDIFFAVTKSGKILPLVVTKTVITTELCLATPTFDDSHNHASFYKTMRLTGNGGPGRTDVFSDESDAKAFARMIITRDISKARETVADLKAQLDELSESMPS